MGKKTASSAAAASLLPAHLQSNAQPNTFNFAAATQALLLSSDANEQSDSINESGLANEEFILGNSNLDEYTKWCQKWYQTTHHILGRLQKRNPQTRIKSLQELYTHLAVAPNVTLTRSAENRAQINKESIIDTSISTESNSTELSAQPRDKEALAKAWEKSLPKNAPNLLRPWASLFQRLLDPFISYSSPSSSSSSKDVDLLVGGETKIMELCMKIMALMVDIFKNRIQIIIADVLPLWLAARAFSVKELRRTAEETFNDAFPSNQVRNKLVKLCKEQLILFVKYHSEPSSTDKEMEASMVVIHSTLVMLIAIINESPVNLVDKNKWNLFKDKEFLVQFSLEFQNLIGIQKYMSKSQKQNLRRMSYRTAKTMIEVARVTDDASYNDVMFKAFKSSCIDVIQDDANGSDAWDFLLSFFKIYIHKLSHEDLKPITKQVAAMIVRQSPVGLPAILPLVSTIPSTELDCAFVHNVLNGLKKQLCSNSANPLLFSAHLETSLFCYSKTTSSIVEFRERLLNEHLIYSLVSFLIGKIPVSKRGIIYAADKDRDIYLPYVKHYVAVASTLSDRDCTLFFESAFTKTVDFLNGDALSSTVLEPVNLACERLSSFLTSFQNFDMTQQFVLAENYKATFFECFFGSIRDKLPKLVPVVKMLGDVLWSCVKPCLSDDSVKKVDHLTRNIWSDQTISEEVLHYSTKVFVASICSIDRFEDALNIISNSSSTVCRYFVQLVKERGLNYQTDNLHWVRHFIEDAFDQGILGLVTTIVDPKGFNFLNEETQLLLVNKSLDTLNATSISENALEFCKLALQINVSSKAVLAKQFALCGSLILASPHLSGMESQDRSVEIWLKFVKNLEHISDAYGPIAAYIKDHIQYLDPDSITLRFGQTLGTFAEFYSEFCKCNEFSAWVIEVIESFMDRKSQDSSSKELNEFMRGFFQSIDPVDVFYPYLESMSDQKILKRVSSIVLSIAKTQEVFGCTSNCLIDQLFFTSSQSSSVPKSLSKSITSLYISDALEDNYILSKKIVQACIFAGQEEVFTEAVSIIMGSDQNSSFFDSEAKYLVLESFIEITRGLVPPSVLSLQVKNISAACNNTIRDMTDPFRDDFEQQMMRIDRALTIMGCLYPLDFDFDEFARDEVEECYVNCFKIKKLLELKETRESWETQQKFWALSLQTVVAPAVGLGIVRQHSNFHEELFQTQIATYREAELCILRIEMDQSYMQNKDRMISQNANFFRLIGGCALVTNEILKVSEDKSLFSQDELQELTFTSVRAIICTLYGLCEEESTGDTVIFENSIAMLDKYVSLDIIQRLHKDEIQSLLPLLRSRNERAQLITARILRKCSPQSFWKESEYDYEEDDAIPVLLPMITQGLTWEGFSEDISHEEDNTPSYEFVKGYLLFWNVFLELLGRSSQKEDHGIFQEAGLDYLRSHFDLFEEFMLRAYDCTKIRDGDNSRLGILAYDTFSLALGTLPTLSRRWFTDHLSRALENEIESFSKKHICPDLIRTQIEAAKSASFDASSGGQSGELRIKGSATTREVVAIYEFSEVALEVTLKLPETYPLRQVEVNAGLKIGLSEARWRKILLGMKTLLSMRDGSLIDAIELWRQNLDKHFEGIEECPICYSVLQLSTGAIPKKQCRTCKHKFHAACLCKWFSTSNSSACPMCRSAF